MLHSVSEYLSDCLVRIPPVILSSSPYLLVSLCLSQAGTVRALAAVVATPIQQLEVDTKQSFSLTMELELEDARMGFSEHSTRSWTRYVAVVARWANRTLTVSAAFSTC